MAYVGTPLDTTNAFQSLAGKRFSGDGSTTDFTLDSSPNSTLDIEVFVGNVRQDPNSAYTVSGTTLTFTGAPPSGTNNIYVVHQAKAVGTIGIPDDTLSSQTDIGGAIADADLFLIDDGAGGTLRKTAASRIKTYAGFDTDAAVVFNESGNSVDFRVESNTDTHCLMVDGSGDKVGIGEDVPEGKLHVMTGDASVGPNANADELIVEGSAHTGLSILSGTSSTGNIYFGDSGDDDIGKIYYNHSDNSLNFFGNATNFLYMDSSIFVFNEDSADIDFRVESNGNTHAIFVNAGDDNVLFLNSAGGTANAHFGIASNAKVTNSRDGGTPIEINRNTNDGNLVDLRQGGTVQGTISVSGSTVGYNTFMGSHWSQLADNSKPTILRGTVLETIADMCVWYTVKFDRNQHNDKDTEYHYEEYELPSGKKVGDTVSITHADDISYSGVIEKESNLTLPKFKISDTEESKAVYGVFHTWDDDDDGKNWQNDASIAALGTYMIRIHKDETVAIGDYIQSKGDGTGKKQADDILRASTIGKVTSTEKVITHGDGSYCVPCTLHCG